MLLFHLGRLPVLRSYIKALFDEDIKASDLPNVKFEGTLKTLMILGVYDIELWTDGPVVEKMGGGAASIYTGEYCETIMSPFGPLCSTFRAELIVFIPG